MRAGDRPVHIVLGLNPYALGLLGLLLALAVISMAAAFARIRALSAQPGYDPGAYRPLDPSTQASHDLDWRIVSGQAVASGGAIIVAGGETVVVAGAPAADMRWVTVLDPRPPRSASDLAPVLLVRFADVDHHYRIYLTPAGDLVLSKVSGGGETELERAALDALASQEHTFEIEAQGTDLRVWLDGKLALTHKDPRPILSPAIGFMTRGGAAALTVLELHPLPR